MSKERRSFSRKEPSFSPHFQQVSSYGLKKVSPKNSRKGERPTVGPPSTLSPAMKNMSWVVSPQCSLQAASVAKEKEEQRCGAGALSRILPLSKKSHQQYVLQTALGSLDNSSRDGSLQRSTNIVILQETVDGEEEKLALIQVASFSIRETPEDKYPWAVVNRETGLEIAYYRQRTTNFASHLEQSEDLQRQHGLNLELYGKTPLYENQKYRKKDDKEIIYHWASTKIKHASTLLRCISFSEQMEMVTKHETPQDYKLVKGKSENQLLIQSSKSRTAVATCDVVDDGQQMRVTVAPKVDPALILLFLAMTAPYRGAGTP